MSDRGSTMKPYLAMLAIAAMTLAGVLPAGAAGLDGQAPAICATTETFDCTPDSDCIKDTPESVNLPRFIWIDFAAKQARTKRTSGEERTAEIRSVEADDAMINLQGMQAGHGWSMAITKETGAMSLAISGDEMGFVVFGVCTTM
jgi:hypothetical protein